MDPDICLRELLNITDQINNGDRDRLDQDEVVDLCDRVAALDHWLKNGGFLPKRWFCAARDRL